MVAWAFKKIILNSLVVVEYFTITILLSMDKIQGDIDKNEELMDTWGYILYIEREINRLLL